MLTPVPYFTDFVYALRGVMASSTPPLPNVTFSQFFTPRYTSLNGTRLLGATRADIERSLLMVGYPSARRAVVAAGRWRAKLLSNLVRGYLTNNLASTDYFRGLEPSERISMSFLLGQAFSHFAFQRHLRVPILLHVQGIAAVSRPTMVNAHVKSGAGIVKDKGVPDFIGIDATGFHVVEAKARSLQNNASTHSGSVAKQCMKGALAQVSKVNLVNGLMPKTRSGAVWVLKSTGVSGLICDPPTTYGFDWEIDRCVAIKRAFSLPLDLLKLESSPSKVGDFVQIEFDDLRKIAIHRKILEALNKLPDRNGDVEAGKFLNLLDSMHEYLYNEASSPGFRCGSDGIALVSEDDIDFMPEPLAPLPQPID